MGTPAPTAFTRKLEELVDLIARCPGPEADHSVREQYRTLYDMAFSPRVGEQAKVRHPTSRPTEDVAVSERAISLRHELTEITRGIDAAVRAMNRLRRLAGTDEGLKEQPRRVSPNALITQDELNAALERRHR